MGHLKQFDEELVTYVAYFFVRPRKLRNGSIAENFHFNGDEYLQVNLQMIVGRAGLQPVEEIQRNQSPIF